MSRERAERMAWAIADAADRLSELASTVRNGNGLIPFTALIGQPKPVIAALAVICKGDEDAMVRVFGESLAAAYAAPTKKPARVAARVTARPALRLTEVTGGGR